MTSDPMFDLAVEPWIDHVHADGSTRSGGFEQVLLDAASITDLALPYPVAYGGMYRILAAMACRISGLDRLQDGERAQEWYQRRNRLFGTAFDETQVRQYFEGRKERLSLYHPVHPFLQDTRIAKECRSTSGINKLVIGAANGSARPWFGGKHGDRNQHPVRSGEAALQLVMWAYYGPGGTVATRTHGAVSTQSGCQAAPLRGTVSYHPIAQSLHDTLLAHLTPPKAGDTNTAGEEPADVAVWERDWQPDPTRPAPEPQGPVSLLAGRMRHAILLTPGEGGSAATDCIITWGSRSGKEDRDPGAEFIEAYPDPYVSYRRTKEGRPTAPVLADGGRHLFRDLDVLLNDPDADESDGAVRAGSASRPLVLAGCTTLPPDIVETLRLRVVGAEQDRSKTRDSQWWTSTTPPLLAHSRGLDPEGAELITLAVQVADHAEYRLDQALRLAFNDRPKDKTHTANRKARIAAHYWPRANVQFWALYTEGQLTAAQARMRIAALDAFDRITAPLALSPSTARRVAQARAHLPRPRKETP
ncbi:type I-E CRISPR-associated protein Cse1/CasA [Kitasatospora sp. NPDC002040]|uniref:type I-E CRISPR-associated protein Cse1/CasA n=1 Tax=Kitasatospora sp. NPDC002040 TaxID=3154661 RepID=UPI003324204E